MAEEQPIPPVQSEVPASKPCSQLFSSKVIPFALMGILALVIAVFVGIQIGKSGKNQGAVTPATPTEVPTPTIDPTADWKTYVHKKIPDYQNWFGFTLYYPPSWNISVEQNNSTFPSFLLTLKKEQSEIKIMQAASGGGSCLYSGDPDQDGPHTRYESYKEIIKNDDSIWRIGFSDEVEKPDNFLGVCSKDPKGNSFYGTTPAGTFFITIQGRNHSDLQEIYQILEKIQIAR